MHENARECTIGRGQLKSVRVNGVRQHRLIDFIGQFNAVSFSSTDIEVVRGEPSLRRRFLDLEISQIGPSYVYALAHYRRILEQRNRLLKAIREGGTRGSLGDSLAVWDEQLLEHGSQMVQRRGRAVGCNGAVVHPLRASEPCATTQWTGGALRGERIWDAPFQMRARNQRSTPPRRSRCGP